MKRIPEFKQSTVNLIVIIGVVIIAAGAWTMPMYQAKLSHDDALEILDDLGEVQSDTNDIQGDISGDGIQVGDTTQDLIGIVSSTLPDDVKSKLFGDDSAAFETEFLKFDKNFQQFSNIEVKNFNPANPRFKFPNDLTGFAVNEAANQPNNTTCNANGVALDTDAGTGGVQPLSANEPRSIDGFALQAPADFDPGAGTVTAAQIIEIQICMDPGPVIVDDVIQLAAGVLFTKNFEFGVIPPGQNLKILIHDATNLQPTYRFWIVTDNPNVIPINFVTGVGGGAATFNPCTSITVNVDTGDVGTAPDAGLSVPVGIHGAFIPIGANKITTNGVAQFTAADFGGQMPATDYNIDVFPILPGQFPQHAFTNCPNNGTPTVTITLATAADFVAAFGSQQGNLVVNIKNQFGVPIPNTRAFVDAVFAPLINDVCENGGAAACFEGTTDVVSPGTLVDPAADGTFTINNLPLPPAPAAFGTYNVNVCGPPPISCVFQAVNVAPNTTTTVDITLFNPNA